MCGAFGYWTTKNSTIKTNGLAANELGQHGLRKVVEGLHKLEYRGYDSWGLAFPLDNIVETHKSLGALPTANAEAFDLPIPYALGHTRWATHGVVNLENCHPHVSQCGRFALVHNGIVENEQALRAELRLSGACLQGDTDTEVVLRLLERTLTEQKNAQDANTIPTALRTVFKRLKGRNTLVLMAVEQDLLMGIRNGSPLVIGRRTLGCHATQSHSEQNRKINNNNTHAQETPQPQEIFIASDCNAFAEHAQECLVLEDQQYFVCEKDALTLHAVDTGEQLPCPWQTLSVDDSDPSSKAQFEHYMLKEIFEQWQTIPRAAQTDDQKFEELAAVMTQHSTNLYITGAGAAFFIGEQIAFMLRQMTQTPVTAFPAYESETYHQQMQAGDVLIAISQSGETADTLCAVQAAQQKGVIIASVVNMPGALLSRLSDFDFYSRSGPEMCVLSTKSGTAQLAFGYLLAQHLLMQTSAAPKSQTEKNISKHNLVHSEFKKDFTDDNKNTVPALRNTAHTNIDALIPALSQFFKPENLQEYVDLAQQIKGEHLFLLGHGKFLATAKIGALNIKEASYIHAEAFSAGELKHGVIALIEAGTPVICFVDEDNQDYMIGVAAQLKARGAWVIGISHQANAVFDETLFFPYKSQDADIIAHIIPCQILAYYLALARGVNPDRPRNLAKSVTVL